MDSDEEGRTIQSNLIGDHNHWSNTFSQQRASINPRCVTDLDCVNPTEECFRGYNNGQLETFGYCVSPWDLSHTCVTDLECGDGMGCHELYPDKRYVEGEPEVNPGLYPRNQHGQPNVKYKRFYCRLNDKVLGKPGRVWSPWRPWTRNSK